MKKCAKPITCDVATECAMKFRRKLRQNCVVISRSALSQNHIYDGLVVYATKLHGTMRRKFVAIAMVMVKKFRRKSVDIATITVGLNFFFYMKYGITILHYNMILPYYIVIWYAILQCNMVMPYYIVICHYFYIVIL
jgi:hypothetical protein